jgi:hypothetical protein
LDKFNSDIDAAENRLKAIEDGDVIIKQIDINLAVKEAEHLGTLQTQLQQIKSLTADGPIVDLTTFNQLREIVPEIVTGMDILSNGTINLSKGLALVN